MHPSERNLQALHSVTGRPISEVSRLLAGFRPGVWVGPSVSPDSIAFAAARLMVGLLVRLYPSVALRAEGKVLEELRGEAVEIHSSVQLSHDADVWVIIGAPEFVTPPDRYLYLGVQGWSALVSPDPVPFDSEGSVLAALTAACLGAWEVFRIAGARAGFINEWNPAAYAWSLLTYEFRPLEEVAYVVAPEPSAVRIPPKTVLVGAGALGHGFAYGLSALPTVSGTLTVVDNRPIKRDTVQRYACQYEGAEGPKVSLLAQWLANRGIRVLQQEKDYLRFLTEDEPTCDIDVMVAAVDRGDTRVRMQAALPRILINGWTGHGRMGLSVHRFVDDQACLACLYAPQGPLDQSEEVRIHNGLRQAIPVERIRRMLQTNQPLDEADVAALVRLGIPSSLAQSYHGKTIQSAYQGLVCSGVAIQVPGAEAIDVPLAFMSTLIGILQAVELVKLAVPDLQVHSLRTRLQFDVLRRPDYPFAPIKKRQGCICTDRDYVQVYREKWGA